MDRKRHYIIMGAGAVGGTMGSLLARSDHRVTLVGRPSLVEAVSRQGGLRHIVAGRSVTVPLEAVFDVGKIDLQGPAILFLTTKAYDVEVALDQARRALPPETLTVTWQNGLRAEETAVNVFPNLLGGVVRATSTMLVPGEVRIRAPGLLIAGRYPPPPPDRIDPELDHIIHDLNRSGFTAVKSPDIRADKGLKLLLNLISGASPLVALKGEPAPNLTRLERSVLLEGDRVLRAAGIPAYAASGQGDDVPAMLVHLAERQIRPPSNDGVHNSTWQNLRISGRQLENGFMNGEIVHLAGKLGMDAPWNRRLLDLLRDVHDRRLGPGALTDEELGPRIRDLPEISAAEYSVSLPAPPPPSRP